jgi:hypothetical protein
MAAQLASEALTVERSIAKINDPVRAKAYAELGIATLCRTGLMMDAVDRYLGLPPSNLPGMLAPVGHHHGPEHERPVPAGGAGSIADSPASPGSSATPAVATREV